MQTIARSAPLRTTPWRAAAVALAALVALALPAAAGTLYLPLAVDRDVDGEHHRTLVWVTNPTNQPLPFAVRFIAQGANGTTGEPDRTLYVPPQGSLVISPAPPGGLGMAELTGPDELVYTGELNAFVGGQLIDSSEVPLAGSQNLVPATVTAHLQALEREPGATTTDLGIANLGTSGATCQVWAYRPGGSQIADTATVTVPPLGHVEFPDAFGILGESRIDGARFAVRCNSPFFPYATVDAEFPDYVKFVPPSKTGRSNLAPPDDRPAASELLRRNGAFFNPNRNNGQLEVELPIARGVPYGSMTIDFDMRTGRFPTNLFVGTVSLLRPVRGGTFFAHTIRANRGITVLDMGVGERLVLRGESGVWRPNTAYHVRVRYDVEAGRITWETFRNGNLVERVVGGIANFKLAHDTTGLKLVFGLSKAYDNAFFPPYGFRFSNLVVRADPVN